MPFNAKLLVKGQQSLHAAPHVIAASATSSYSGRMARALLHPRTTLVRSLSWAGNQTLKRSFSTNHDHGRMDQHGPASGAKDLPLYRKLIQAWSQTPTKWYPLPLAVGALLLVAIQYRHKFKRGQKEVHLNDDGAEIIKLKGPWQVHVLGALPLRNASRLWGYMNEIELPIWFRPYGFRFYAAVFGCNLDEIEPTDLKSYPSLGAFFYRKLKDGARPVADTVLVSPADGKVLHFGTIENLRVEQVKGITYSLDALLGVDRVHDDSTPGSPSSTRSTLIHLPHNPDHSVVADQEFANVNGIEYSLGQLIGVSQPSTPGNMTPVSEHPPPPTQRVASSDAEHPAPKKYGDQIDASVAQPGTAAETLAHDASVALEMGVRPVLGHRRSSTGPVIREGNALFFAVIYLAPGDYHRFHSPTAWVVEKRRHFMGELFSVSPYIAKRLENLFVLNERVALLGRWKHGFFSMVPVGATNVGSIMVNFDTDLRTNLRGRKPPPGTYTEGIYTNASSMLNGQPLRPAEEMGGFRLGSTIVLVFEAPKSFEFKVQAGQHVKVGEAFGDVEKEKVE
ncbi:phosphatidylserine decarboxylase 1 [Athelia psychrophila]|uniref:Phosphatidylserine decarboxylase proenzyme 1, mitochondrial n=1 Tax=Athelia psychrophila TaxID=1759441 RepID=A0A166KMZ9_9AGAM|nr:phosphatidylserine decarboxylase 1 [Fibularhizoctonia sp. CBS 109695]